MRTRFTRSLSLSGIAAVLTLSVVAPAAQAATAPNGGGGFGWIDLAVAVAVLAGIVLLGLYGDVVVGALIFGVVVFFEVGARLTVRAVCSTASRRRRDVAVPDLTPPQIAR
jgi:hypothetical protein